MLTLNDINPHIIKCNFVNSDNCRPPGTRYGRRRVRWYELELVLWGEGCIITGDKRHPAEKGSLFFRKPGMVVQGICPYHCYMVIFDIMADPVRKSVYSDPNCDDSSGFDNSLYEKFASEHFPDYDFPEVFKVKQTANYEMPFRNIYEAYIRNGAACQFFLRTYLLQLLASAYAEWNSGRVLNNPSRSVIANYSKVMMVRDYIQAGYKSGIRLEELASLAGMSPNFLCRIFRDITGANISGFVNECRLNAAKKELIQTNRTMKEISLDCGFSSDTYFFILFKKKEGLSPTEYREKHRLTFIG